MIGVNNPTTNFPKGYGVFPYHRFWYPPPTKVTLVKLEPYHNLQASENIIYERNLTFKEASHSSPFVQFIPEKKAKEDEGEFCPYAESSSNHFEKLFAFLQARGKNVGQSMILHGHWAKVFNLIRRFTPKAKHKIDFFDREKNRFTTIIPLP